MSVCAVAHSLADGTLVLSLDPARTDLSTCPYLVEDGSSNAWQELGNMSLENASVIGAYVGVVWALAYGIRLLSRFLLSGGPEEI